MRFHPNSHIRPLLETPGDLELLGSVDQLWDEFSSGSDKYRSRSALLYRPLEVYPPTESAMQRCPAAPNAAPATPFRVRFRFAASQSGGRYTHVRLTVRHNDTVVLGPHVRLYPLALRGRPIVDVFAGIVSPNK